MSGGLKQYRFHVDKKRWDSEYCQKWIFETSNVLFKHMRSQMLSWDSKCSYSSVRHHMNIEILNVKKWNQNVQKVRHRGLSLGRWISPFQWYLLIHLEFEKNKNDADNKPMSSIFIEFLAPTVTVPLMHYWLQVT